MSVAAEKRVTMLSDSDAILNALPNPVLLIAPDGKIVDANIAADRPACLLQTLMECSDTRLKMRIVNGCGQEDSDVPWSFSLLRMRNDWHRSDAANCRDEVPPPHCDPIAA